MRNFLYFLLFVTTSAFAVDELSLCSQSKEYIEGIWTGKNDPSTSVKWVAGNYSHFNPYWNKTQKETYMQFSHFDINNNGKDDTVIKTMGGIAGNYGDTLTIALDQTIDLSGGFSYSKKPVYDFKKNELYRIASYPPWPYKNQGVRLSQMNPLIINGKTYLVITDTMKRGYFIADYSSASDNVIKGNIHNILLKPICGESYNKSSQGDAKSAPPG